MQQHFPTFTATPHGILINGLPLNKYVSQSLSPHIQHSLQRAAELLKTVKKEDWDNRTPHSTHDIPTLAKAQMLLALASPQPFGKYSPDQLRVPAGNSDGGQWTSGDSDGSGSAPSPSSQERQYADAGNIATDANVDNSTNTLDVKGTIDYLNHAADKLKQDQIDNGEPNKFGEGACAAYVREALNEGGMDVQPPDDGGHGYAKNFGSSLEEAGFNATASATIVNACNAYPPSGYIPQAGDVVVIQPYPGGNPAGHMAMYNGSQWVSDFRQNDIWPGKGYRIYGPPYVIYRYSGTR